MAQPPPPPPTPKEVAKEPADVLASISKPKRTRGTDYGRIRLSKDVVSIALYYQECVISPKVSTSKISKTGGL